MLISLCKFKIIYSGRIILNKGLESYINLIKKLNSNNYVLYLAGEIIANDKYLKIIKKLEKEKKIKIFRSLNKIMLYKLLSESDLFIHISSHPQEGMPNSILDAIECNLPVLCNPCGFISDLYDSSQLNFVNTEDKQIYTKVKEIKKNYKFYKSKASIAYKYTKLNFSEETYLKSLKKLYLLI